MTKAAAAGMRQSAAAWVFRSTAENSPPHTHTHDRPPHESTLCPCRGSDFSCTRLSELNAAGLYRWALGIESKHCQTLLNVTEGKARVCFNSNSRVNYDTVSAEKDEEVLSLQIDFSFSKTAGQNCCLLPSFLPETPSLILIYFCHIP